jgi:hypothetical protein
MLIVDSLIISGVKFVLNKIAEAVEAEMYDDTHLREELLAAQMKLELGEITDEEFGEIEASILAGLREVKMRQRGEVEAAKEHGKVQIESVDAALGHRETPET